MGLFSRQPRALVASAAKLGATRNKGNKDQQSEAWQRNALRYYSSCGEVNFCAKFYARMLARVRFYPATLKEDGTKEAITTGKAVELLDRIQDPGGGRTRIQYDFGRLMFITGEGVLFVSETDDIERWRFLWREEVVTDEKTGTTYRKDAKGQRAEEGTAYRMWMPHPEHSERADSPLRAVLEIAEELGLLTAAVRATAVSRMLSGMLLLPSEVSPPPLEPGKDDDPASSPFLTMLIAHVRASIEDPASAEAKVPFLLEAAYDYLDQVRWVQMHDPQSDYLERDLRIEAIKRLSLGLDMPPEALEGFSNTNHWAAQQIQWDMWRSHGVPIADVFAADLADVYLRPALLGEGQNATDIVVGYDDSQVVISPDQTAVADEAWDRLAIGFTGYRKMKGIPEEYKPTDEEQKLIAGVKMRDPVVAGYEENVPPVRGPQPGPDVSQSGQSNVPPRPSNGRVVSRQESRTASIVGAAHLALRQCRTRAGAKLRQAAKGETGRERCAECNQQIDKIENALVASALGVEGLTQLAMHDPISLVSGGTNDFRGCLQEWGIKPPDVTVLCERIEAYAAKTLFEPNTPDLPPGFAAHVEHALEVSERALAPG